MKALDLREVPVEGRDRVGHVEQARRPRVASPLIVGQRALGPLNGRAREEFSVEEGIGDAMTTCGSVLAATRTRRS